MRKVDNNIIDYELLWIQMKLVGFPEVEQRKTNILSLCGVEIDKENADDKNDNEINTVVDKKNHIKKKVKEKKLTPEEKADRTKELLMWQRKK